MKNKAEIQGMFQGKPRRNGVGVQGEGVATCWEAGTCSNKPVDRQAKWKKENK